MLDELMILARIKEGDIKAFEGIFRRYYSPLCWYAAGITGDTASAEEIVEELFYVLWKNRERLQVFQSVKSYLYRSVRNEAVQFCEHQEVKERYRASVRTESGPGYSSDPHAHRSVFRICRQQAVRFEAGIKPYPCLVGPCLLFIYFHHCVRI